MKPSAEGFLLLDSSFKTIYASPGAIEILTYPEIHKKTDFSEEYLSRRIHTLLLKAPSTPTTPTTPKSGFVTEFKSGKRRYTCRAFSLNSHSRDSDDQPSVALLLERSRRLSLDTFQMAVQFHLTQRERETVEYLMQGLTSKEIAVRMNISPNTVKAFLRLIIVKMGASTRSGIIGKIFAEGN